ncbi:MAG: hypothetical protein Q8P20_00435 [bacterium]|nr:hypothetical protein [bacterium]
MSQIKRGPGAPKGHRPVIWVCEAIVGCECGKAVLKSDKIILQDQNPESEAGSFPMEAAKKIFADNNGVEPEMMHGPMYDKKGGTSKLLRKRGAISRDIANMRLCMTKKQQHGIWDGWRGIANYIENDNEKVYFCFVKELNPIKGKEKAPPAPGKINISELEFCNA